MNQKNKQKRILFNLGVFLIIVSGLLFLLIFSSTIKNELVFLFLSKTNEANIVFNTDKVVKGQKGNNHQIIPVDEQFSIVIPKLNINTKVIANVDPFNEREYREKLKEGVAQAKGSSVPGEKGATFIFAHSSDTFYHNNKNNSLFYLLHKLKAEDIFYLIYKKEIYKYKIIEKKIVEPQEVKYLNNQSNKDSVILMTCWPPGTAYKRLLIFGDRE